MKQHFCSAKNLLIQYEKECNWCGEKEWAGLTDQAWAAIGDEWTPCLKLPVVVHVRQQRNGETHVSTREGITPVKPDDLIMRGVLGEEYPIGRAIFEQTYTLDTTTPPQRTWVGLTDEEIKPCWHEACQTDLELTSQLVVYFARAIEAKLKEKNT